MNIRSVWAVLFLSTAVFVFAEPRTAIGSDKGPFVVLVTGTQGGFNLLHEGLVIRGWLFPGPFSAAIVLAGPLDTLEWDGEEAVLVPGGKEPVAAAQKALADLKSPRLVLVNSDGSSQVVKSVEGEEQMDYDAASAATE